MMIGTVERARYYQWLLHLANTLQPAFRNWFYPTEAAGEANAEATKVQAFIASEDASFFDHPGIDAFGTFRAIVKTLWKKSTGAGRVQGGSTLTQQTAKALLISSEGFAKATKRSGKEGVKRKIREAILAPLGHTIVEAAGMRVASEFQ